MNKKRCACVKMENELYVRYHDEEWGVPVHDDRRLFEFLVLEGAQVGLSWETILNKREAYRSAFAGFDPQLVAEYDDRKQAELLQNAGIVRNRRKIKSAIVNARVFLEIQKEFGSFDKYIWQFVGGEPIQNHWQQPDDIPTQTDISEQISKDLKKRGMSFVGPTIMYAFMQATGLVNDHELGCFCR